MMVIYNRDNNACYNREKRLFLILVVSENKIYIFLNIFSQKALRFGDTRTMCDFEQVNSSLKDLWNQSVFKKCKYQILLKQYWCIRTLDFCKSEGDIQIFLENTNFKFYSQNKIYALEMSLGTFRCSKTVFQSFCNLVKKHICCIICFCWESKKCLSWKDNF